MPHLPKRHGFAHFDHVRRTVIDTIHGSQDAPALTNDERDIASSMHSAELELNHAYVLGTGLFIVLVLGYLSRRGFRSSFARLVHALRTPSHYIQINLHHVHYSRLDTSDTITSPIESEGGRSIDLESAVHASEEEPAPPYSPPPAQALDVRERRAKKPLHITVPPVQSTTSQASESGVGNAPRLASEGTQSSATMTGPPSGSMPSPSSNVQAEKGLMSRARSLSNTGVLLASPIASRFDAYFRPYRTIPIQPHQEDGAKTRLSNVSNRSSETLMSTESPCTSPPPQYTITIHSSHQLTLCDAAGRPAPVPDIVLSPVPWLPREHVPQSPPHYLTIPSRKSRSREQRAMREAKKAASKSLPAVPAIQERKRAEKPAKKAKAAVRHVFSSPVDVPVPTRSMSVPPSSKVSTDSKQEPQQQQQPLVRSATYPLQTPKRAMPPLPPPRPVLPLDLEAVYPTDEEITPPATTESRMSSGEQTEVWRWPTWPAAAPMDRRLNRTENQVRREGYAIEKVAFGEKGGLLGPTDHDSGSACSDPDDIPLAQELLLAMKRRKMAIERKVGQVRDPAFDVPRALRKGLFGGLTALAAKARQVIERELDSDEEEEKEVEDLSTMEKMHVRHRNFVAREVEAVNAFVIGDED